METDVLIIGGGPAGLNAAFEPASNGMNVTIIDESFSFGGQLRSQTQYFDHLPRPFNRERGTNLSRKLIDRLLPFDVDFLPQHTFVGKYKDGTIGVSHKNEVIPINAKKVIIATGAAEEAIMFPGWTLPGVMTIGAAQILMNRDRVMPGKDAIIVGSNEFAFDVVQQLKDVGANVHGIVESDSQMRLQNSQKIEAFKNLGIPLYVNASITEAQGKGKVEKVFLGRNGEKINLDVDLICIAGGLMSILEPFEIMDCKLVYNQALGGWIPEYDKHFETSNQSTYVAGNAAGITSIGGILTTGELTGVSVMASLGVLKSEEAAERKRDLWHQLYQIEGIQRPDTYHARLAAIKDFNTSKDRTLTK
ncbi:NAD(P)/FAD-dependent oxidoreductase [Lentibacillus sp. CBA3610]|uniref:NAD(P)/FAD-dependent oxidoreductase n=1 Tax=Lentibacillus sp. CBA3610 TaxID=2518176 RepID=UPI0015957721|nr:FAD-dependent oxidoreductase [Lentibacillus sp. CBA3610]QKY70213.1 FAD-binding protein [Lentibacillus sp. CBA3610]